MVREKAGAYHEAQKRIQETIKDEERSRLEDIQEHFDKKKETLYTKNKFDIFWLRNRITIGQSLSLLQQELQKALSQWEISQEEYNETIQTLEIQEQQKEKEKKEPASVIVPDEIPFGKTKIAKKLENQVIWENIWADIVWFLYGFVVQGSAILVILAWNILLDAIMLPKDMWDTFHNSQK